MENVKLKKTTRHAETRDIEARKTVWSPPRQLDAPEPPEGFKFRWLRESIQGQPDDKNITSRLREGYELVREDELSAEDKLKYPSLAEGKYKGVIGVGGLLLMRCPIEVKEDRDAYFRRLTDDQMASVDNDLMKNEHPSMPISKERQSRVTFGGKKDQ